MQKGYEWLWNEPGPKMILAALNLYGTKEVAGKGSNPVIMAWANDLGLDKVYSDDDIPWCGLLMAKIAKEAGKEIPNGPLWALNWAKFGSPVTTAMLGDVLVFKRPTGGHVGLYVGEDKVCYHVLGGNQGNMVNITRVEKNRKYAIRRPIYINQPTNVRKIILQPTGLVSVNEA